MKKSLIGFLAIFCANIAFAQQPSETVPKAVTVVYNSTKERKVSWTKDLTLMTAIAYAGGLDTLVYKRCLLVRNGKTILKISTDKLLSVKEQLVKHGDTIYID